MSKTELAGADPPRKSGVAPSARRVGAGLVLRAHRLADRLDLLPPEFGEAVTVDDSNVSAVAAEWLRCLRLWASYNPEEVFALKVGAVLVGVAVAGLWLMIAFMQ